MYLKIEVEMFIGVQLKESVEDLIISFFDLLKNVEVFDIVYLKQRKFKFLQIESGNIQLVKWQIEFFFYCIYCML